MSDGLLVFIGIVIVAFINGNYIYKMGKTSGEKGKQCTAFDWVFALFYFSLLSHTRNPSHQTRTPAPHSRSGFMSFLNLTSPESIGLRPKILEVPDLAWGGLEPAEFQVCSPARRLELLGESELTHLETLGCNVLTP